jgi:predicted  nucleic acid-binding Zn-ribbon protein
MNQALADLYELQKVDSALDLAKKQFQALDQGRAEKAAAESAKELAERLTRERDDSHGDLTDAELELQGVEKKKKDYETKLYSGKVTSPKELLDIQHEIDALGRQRAMLDDKILSLMEQLERRRTEAADSDAQRKAAESALEEKQSHYKRAARALAVTIDSLGKQRAEMAAGIPAPLLKRYDAFRAAKHGIGIGKVEGNSCGACHTNLPSNLLRRALDTDSVELCENCGRMLYVGA